MYQYSDQDRQFLQERVSEFKDQVARRLKGELSEEQFQPLRLLNGLYLQLHAYMLRVAIPYGILSSAQLRVLAQIAEAFDKGYGHFTTRQNIQFNWMKLEDVPEILTRLASVDMHAVQTSGNAIRNVTTDPFAGVAADEIADPRPFAEIIRQWSTLHPEFSFLPRKFKIAVSGAREDRTALRFHDIGIAIALAPAGDLSFRILVGGGMGRSPFVAKELRSDLPACDLLAYLEAILRVYNAYGRRDNIYKARIKILVHELGIEKFKESIEREFADLRGGALRLSAETIARYQRHFPDHTGFDGAVFEAFESGGGPELRELSAFEKWRASNVHPHRNPAYAIVSLSLKEIGRIPGDATAHQMRRIADLAETFAFGEIRVTKEQNLIFPSVSQLELPALWQQLDREGLATPNIGRATDIVACPGLDFCKLANARSIPVAQALSEELEAAGLSDVAGSVSIKISGCINACGHHHGANIGILGVDKKGDERYQLVLGGESGNEARIGKITGPGFSEAGIVQAVRTSLDVYVRERADGETFAQAYKRLGPETFKEALYG
jgi:sulfite reductase (NADPH) hemoprotein beta-component